MKLARVLRSLRDAPEDRDTIRNIGRDFGDELPRNRLDVIRDVRSALAALPSGDSWASGYRSALLDVASAYDTALSARREDSDAVALARNRKWQPVLEHLAFGPTTQKDVADRLKMDPAQVSRILGDMRKADLAEVRAPDGIDARTRPHALSMRGEAVLQKLKSESDSYKELTEILIKFVVGTLAKVFISGSLSPDVLSNSARRALLPHGFDPHFATARLSAHLLEEGLLSAKDDALVAETVAVPYVVALLFSATSFDQPPVFWPDIAHDDGGHAYIVRSSPLTTDKWKAMLVQAKSRASPTARVNEASRTISSADLNFGVEVRSPFTLIYDDPMLLKRELADPTVQHLFSRASRTFCFVDQTQDLGSSLIQLPISKYVERSTSGHHRDAD